MEDAQTYIKLAELFEAMANPARVKIILTLLHKDCVRATSPPRPALEAV